MDPSTRVEQVASGTNRVRLTMEIQRFRLPPVESALVVGKKASIGPKAMSKALSEMLPGQFTLLEVEHAVVEAIILRTAHLRRVPQDKLIAVILEQCDNLMDETDMIHFDIEIRVRATADLEL